MCSCSKCSLLSCSSVKVLLTCFLILELFWLYAVLPVVLYCSYRCQKYSDMLQCTIKDGEGGYILILKRNWLCKFFHEEQNGLFVRPQGYTKLTEHNLGFSRWPWEIRGTSTVNSVLCRRMQFADLAVSSSSYFSSHFKHFLSQPQRTLYETDSCGKHSERNMWTFANKLFCNSLQSFAESSE